MLKDPNDQEFSWLLTAVVGVFVTLLAAGFGAGGFAFVLGPLAAAGTYWVTLKAYSGRF